MLCQCLRIIKNANICQCFLNGNAESPEQLWMLIITLSIYSYFESCWSVDEGFLSALEKIVSFRVSFIRHTSETSIYNDDDSSWTFLNSFCNARGVRLTKSYAVRMTSKWNYSPQSVFKEPSSSVIWPTTLSSIYTLTRWRLNKTDDIF